MDYYRWSTNECKKFVLNRTLFDLVNSYQYLDLGSNTLLGWYSELSSEEKKIIQDEGGLYQFLVKHPALVVAEEIGVVHVKSQIRRNSRSSNFNRGTTFYGPTVYEEVGASWFAGCSASRCPPPLVEMFCLTGEQPEPWMWGASSGHCHHPCPRYNVQSACDESLASVLPYSSQRGPSFQRLSREWREGMTSVQGAIARIVLENGSECQGSTCSSPPPTLDQFGEQERADSLMPREGSVEHSEKSPATSSTMLFSDEASASLHSSPGGAQGSSATTADKNLHHHEPREEMMRSLEKPYTSSSPQSTDQDLPSKLGRGQDQKEPTEDHQPKSNSVVFPSSENSRDGVEVSPKAPALVTSIQGVDYSGNPIQKCLVSPSTTYSLRDAYSPAFFGVDPPTTASQTIDASGDFRAHFTSVQECQASPSTTVASTEMDSPAHLDQDTQTIQTSTADRSVITDIFMTDLDFVAKEFCRLKAEDEELELLKMKQLKPNATCGCECGERWKESELKLLALQYSMCKEHCWRRYLTSAQGERDMQGSEEVPVGLVESLRVLEETYSQMRRRLLSGATLEELDPLSVDTHRLNTNTLYTPAQKVHEEEVQSKPPVASQQLQNETSAEMNLQEDATENPGNNDNLKKAAELHMRPGPIKPLASGVCEEEIGVEGEAWFDAVEVLGLAGGCLQEEDRFRKGKQSERRTGIAMESSDGRKMGPHQNDVNEQGDLQCEKTKARDGSLTVSDKPRTGSVRLSSPDIAEAAMQDLSGSFIHGQPLQISHTTSSSSSCPPAAPPQGDHTFKRPQPPTTTTTTYGPKPSSVKVAAPYNMLPRPIITCQMKKLLNISPVPTALGTWVPLQLPPSASSSNSSFARQQVMEALLKQHGPLNNLQPR
ncbi:RNA-binding protein 44-like isoform X2 [Engraulis encrasicolus]|uniref:RNA-binding protein 44-like isoform X2 n=1 Tax=Engraulis encrasicolus TaxID=184585 RepID=UPI002FD0192A